MIGRPMGDVVSLAPKVPDNVVWRCNCGCISFELRADGDAVCVHCEHPVAGIDGVWREKLPEPVAPIEAVGDHDLTVTDFNSSAPALRRALGRADADKTAMVIVIQQDGTVTTWGDTIEGEAQEAWFDRRVETAKTMLTKREA